MREGFPVRIKTGYKTSIKPEITHNYPSFWIVGSTKNIHKFLSISLHFTVLRNVFELLLHTRAVNARISKRN